MSQVQKELTRSCNCAIYVYFQSFWVTVLPKTLDSVTMATEVKIKELSMNDFVLGENNQVQKVSLKSETMREKLCSIFTENCS